MSNNDFQLGKGYLTPELSIAIIQKEVKAIFTNEVKQQINASAQKVQNIVDSDKTVYGINTGFGPLCTVKISKAESRQLQEKILKSHAVGMGDNLEDDLVRLMLLTKLHALAKGYSGIQLDTIERIQYLLNNDILPVVPAQGSVGASGDLAPLSHLFLPLIGLGVVQYKGKIVATQEVYKELNLEPILLGPKEGLALINGTQFILAHSVLGLHQFKNALERADLLGALMVDALQGSTSPFKEELHLIRPYPGTLKVAANMRKYLEGSSIPEAHAFCDRVQDPYSLRCMPQVHGASRNAYQHLYDLTLIELNSVTDNPIITDDGSAISGGNFHGQPLAMALDYATLATAELGNIADRRIYLSLEGEKVSLPKLLMKNAGLDSGFMILQYTTAALVSENKSFCFPASADSVPTSMGQEDHVSMGSISGRKFLMVLNNIKKIQVIEAMVGAQALEFIRPIKSSETVEALHSLLRTKVPFFEEDEIYSDYFKPVEQLFDTVEFQQLYSQNS